MKGISEGTLRDLVTQAALCDPGTAEKAWNSALSLSPIDDWPNELARPLPLIYLNLRQLPDVRHGQLLKGIYRAAWATNMLRVRSAIDVMRAIDECNVDYRLIKGGAVCALTGDWGSRRMGDLDLAIPHECADLVRNILGENGFRQRFTSRSIDGLWENTRGGRLDLHSVRHSDRNRRWILDYPGRLESVLLYDVKIPAPEVTIALCVDHANTGAADSDFIQGMLDVARLVPMCDEEHLCQVLKETNRSAMAITVFTALDHVGAAVINPDFMRKLRLKNRVATLVKVITVAQRSARKIFPVLLQRRQSVVSLTRKCGDLKRYPMYLTWLSFGQIRYVERLRIALRGGFLPRPEGILPMGINTLIEFGSELARTQIHTSIRISGVEDRFRLALHSDERIQLRIALHTRDDSLPRMIFVNGRMQGYLPPDDALSVRLDVWPVKSSVEISLRLHPGAHQPSSPVYVMLEGLTP